MMLNKFHEWNFDFFMMMGYYFSRKEIIKEMDCQLYSNKNMTWYILYTDVWEVRGFCSVEKREKDYYLDNFYIVEKYRGLGYGKKILHKVMNDYKNEKICLITRNEIAKKMYEKTGFEIVGQNGRYYKMEYCGGTK